MCLCVGELASFIVPILQQLLRGRASFPLSQRSLQWPIVIALICKSSVVCRKLSACMSVCVCVHVSVTMRMDMSVSVGLSSLL